jgi:hypothetical protein
MYNRRFLNRNSKLLYLARLSFINEGEKNLPYIQNLKVFMTTKPTLMKMLKRIPYIEKEGKHSHEICKRKIS